MIWRSVKQTISKAHHNQWIKDSWSSKHRKGKRADRQSFTVPTSRPCWTNERTSKRKPTSLEGANVSGTTPSNSFFPVHRIDRLCRMVFGRKNDINYLGWQIKLNLLLQLNLRRCQSWRLWCRTLSCCSDRWSSWSRIRGQILTLRSSGYHTLRSQPRAMRVTWVRSVLIFLRMWGKSSRGVNKSRCPSFHCS